MDISKSNSRSRPGLEAELSRLTHDLMGGVSSLLMCEHMITRELAHNAEAQTNLDLQTTMTLMRQTAAQIRQYGENLLDLAHRFQGRESS